MRSSSLRPWASHSYSRSAALGRQCRRKFYPVAGMEQKFQIIDGHAVRSDIAVTEYDLLDYYGPAHRRRGAEEWTVVADLPEVVTISPQMLDVLELWFGDILDELLIDECASREHGDHAHGD